MMTRRLIGVILTAILVLPSLYSSASSMGAGVRSNTSSPPRGSTGNRGNAETATASACGQIGNYHICFTPAYGPISQPMRVVIRNWNGGTQNIDSTPGCAADCTYSLTKYADFYLDYHAHFVYDSPPGPNAATIYIHNGIWCVEDISCDKSVAYPPLPNDDHRCGRVNAYQICIIPASGPISQPMRVVIRNWNGGTQNIDSTPGCAADCTYSLTKYADSHLDYHAHFVYDSPLGPNPATIYIHNGIWCVEGLSCGTMPPKQPTPPNTPLLASKLKWFPNTPDNGFQIGKGDEFQLAVLDPNDGDRAIRRVVFFAKWPNRPWSKLRCDGPSQDATRTRPWARVIGDKNDTLYTCDVTDTVTDTGQVQFSFDVDGPGSHVTPHPDGIRTGQNHAYHDCYTSSCAPNTDGHFGPHDFQRAYSVHGDARGVNIGIIFGGVPLSPADLAVFAFNTRTPKLKTGSHGPDTVEWRFIGSIAHHRGADHMTKLELAMDVEYAHAMAPGSHLVVWLLPIAKDGGSDGVYGSLAIREAANSEARIVSNSWHVLNPSCPGATLPGGKLPNAYNHQAEALALAEQKGKTFFVDSGDSGEDSGCSPDVLHSTSPTEAAFPAMSPHVVAVGGTSLIPGKGEFAWGATSASTGHAVSSGGGCAYRPDLGIVRPKWQTGIHPNPNRCDRRARAVPDVAADADTSLAYRGAYIVYTDGGTQYIEGSGGTSLATPLWAGMAADLQSYLQARGRKLDTFMAPGLYALATNPVTGPRDFHDITAYAPGEEKGNGFPIGKGWDEVTGWGSPNLAHLEEDWAATDGGLHFPPAPQPHGPSLRVGPGAGQPGSRVSTIDGDGFPATRPVSLTLCAGIAPSCQIGVGLQLGECVLDVGGRSRRPTQPHTAGRTGVYRRGDSACGIVPRFGDAAYQRQVRTLPVGGTHRNGQRRLV